MRLKKDEFHSRNIVLMILRIDTSLDNLLRTRVRDENIRLV